MEFCAVVTLLVILLVDQSFAKQSCKTCRGEDCSKKDVLQLDCTKFVPALPFESQLLISNNVGDLKYGCLDLEYYIDETVDHLQQCIQATDLQSFCDLLEYSLKIKNCNVESAGGTRNTRSLRVIETSLDELQSVKVAADTDTELEEDSSDPTGPTDPPTTTVVVETTTGHASTVHLISLSSFLSVLAILLLK